MSINQSELDAAIPVVFDEKLKKTVLDNLNATSLLYVGFANYTELNDKKLQVKKIPVRESHVLAEDNKYIMKVDITLSDISTDASMGLIYLKNNTQDDFLPIGRFMFSKDFEMFDALNNTYTLTLSLPYRTVDTLTRETIPEINILSEAEAIWYEKHVSRINIEAGSKKHINVPCKNIGVVFNNETSLYLLYKAKNKNIFFMGIFELQDSEMIKPFRLKIKSELLEDKTFHGETIATDATGTSADETHVTWYLSHTKGVSRLQVENIDKRVASEAREIYKNLSVGKDTTLARFKNFHLLNCGSLNTWRPWYCTSHNGKREQAATSYWLSYTHRHNPITEYVDNYMYSIGGQIGGGWHMWFIERKPIYINVLEDKFRNSDGISSKLVSQNVKITVPNNFDINTFNTNNFISASVGKKIYIFSRELFKDKNNFYCINTASVDKKLNCLVLPPHILDKVKAAGFTHYTDITITNTDETIYFVLTKSDATTLSNQIIGFNVKLLDKEYYQVML